MGKRRQLCTSFFLRAKNRMFSICGRGGSCVLLEEFLLTGRAGSGDRLSELGLSPEWALPSVSKNVL